MRFAVREQVIDDHANNGEEEDNKAPDELVDRRAVRFDDLDYADKDQYASSYGTTGIDDGKILPQAMISRISTISPTIPPPVGACQFWW